VARIASVLSASNRVDNVRTTGQVGRGFLDRLRAGVDYVGFQWAEAGECPVQAGDRLCLHAGRFALGGTAPRFRGLGSRHAAPATATPPTTRRLNRHGHDNQTIEPTSSADPNNQ
jgi:hypothetical protein